MKTTWAKSLCVVAAVALVCGCGGRKECKLDDPNSCSTDQICESVTGQDKPACFDPVELRGKVVDLATGAGIAKAQVTALDVNGSPLGQVATTADDGTYALRVPETRDPATGNPTGRTVLLRAAAQDYQPFPSGVRISLPVDTGPAAQKDKAGPWILSSPQTEIGLTQLDQSARGRPKIVGTVEVTAGQLGVLVVGSSSAGNLSTIADSKGAFTLFNAAPASYTLRAYGKGQSYQDVAATVASGQDLTGVKIVHSQAATGTLTGTVQIVSGTGQTSVVMVVEDTFDANLVRGEVPPGLRAPPPPTAPNVTGTFTIEGVPDGKYVVLAAFENDGLIRDPNPNTAGTELQHLTMSGGVPSVQPAFKVTSAISLTSPGAGDAIDSVGASPTFTWVDYPSAKAYDLKVYDTFGTKIWEKLNFTPTGTSPQQAYGGPALTHGLIYQWRLTAYGQAANPISTSEDLKGLFRVQ